MLFTALSLAVLLALCCVFASLRGVGGGAAPLLAVATVMVYFTFALLAGVLAAAGWVFVALVAAGLIWALLRRRKVLWAAVRAPGFLIFCGLSVILLVYLGVRQPVFSFWDEFSFAGPAAKILTLYNQSYAMADTGYFVTLTQRPGLPLLSWFVHFFGGPYAQWRSIYAAGLLLLACASGLTAAFGPRGWRTAVPLAACGLLAPFFFGLGYETVTLAAPWLSVYLDIAAGMLAGATLALYFSVRRNNPAAAGGGLWQVLLPLAASALVKDNTVPIALVAAGVMAADCLFFGVGATDADKRKGQRRDAPFISGLRRVAARIAAAIGFFAAVLAAYLPWSSHAAAAAAQNTWFAGRETNMPISEAAAATFGELFGFAPRSEPMTRVLGELPAYFMGRTPAGAGFNVSMAGSPLVTVALILAVLALAIVCARGKRARLRAGLAAGLLGAGFAAYHFMLVMNWAVFSHTRAETGVVEYDRYLSSYNLAWFMPAACLLALAAQNMGGHRRAAALRRLARAGVLALALFFSVRATLLLRPGYSVLDFPQPVYADERATMAAAEALAARVPQGERVFFVSQAPDEEGGQSYLRYWFYMMPTVLDYSLTGGWHFVPPPEGMAEGDPGWNAYVPLEKLTDYLRDNELEYILVERLDEVFTSAYGGLFADGLSGWPGVPALYRLGAGGLYERVVDA